MDFIVDWFCEYKDAIGGTLIACGAILNFISVVAKIGCITIAVGSVMILIGIWLLLINCL